MNPRLLDFLADPHDGQALELHVFEGSRDSVRQGILRHPQSGRWYPIRDGIPSLFIDALREDDGPFAARFGDRLRQLGCEVATKGGTEDTAGDLAVGDFARIESERRARDEQAEYYDRLLSLKVYEAIEIPAYRAVLQEWNRYGGRSSGPLLEAGCGTGRFTGLFASLSREVVAVDMSRDSILRNRVRHAGKTVAPVHYVHADLTHLPVRDDVCGPVAHCGVYEHIPSRELRQQFLGHARRVMGPGAILLLSAYRYGGLTTLFEKQGEHAGGIPFTRFTEAELREEVEAFFTIEKFRPNLGVYMSMLVARPK